MTEIRRSQNESRENKRPKQIEEGFLCGQDSPRNDGAGEEGFLAVLEVIAIRRGKQLLLRRFALFEATLLQLVAERYFDAGEGAKAV